MRSIIPKMQNVPSKPRKPAGRKDTLMDIKNNLSFIGWGAG